MILLFNHTLTQEQKDDAISSFGVKNFTSLPTKLQDLWSTIPPDAESVLSMLVDIKQFIIESSQKGEHILIQGDFGATYHMVEFSKSLGLVPVYATTTRRVVEKLDEDKVLKTSIFKHERFRKYEKLDEK